MIIIGPKNKNVDVAKIFQATSANEGIEQKNIIIFKNEHEFA